MPRFDPFSLNALELVKWQSPCNPSVGLISPLATPQPFGLTLSKPHAGPWYAQRERAG